MSIASFFERKYLLLTLGAGLVLFLLVLLFLTQGNFSLTPRSVEESKRPYHIGIVVRGSSYEPGVDGFRSQMKTLGYVEGDNVIYSVKFVDKREDLPAAIDELLKKGVDVLHTYSTPATVEAYKLTKTVPIVFGSMGDPVASKTVESLERPGTNVTGVGSLSAPLVVKRLEFLLEAAPGVKKVAFPLSSDDIPGQSSYTFILEAAPLFGVEVVPYFITPERPVIETARAISREDVDGIVLSSDSLTWAFLHEYVRQSIQEKLPFAVFDKDMVRNGGLVGYGPDYFASGQQSAVLVDKILMGQDPGSLPVEPPKKLVLAVNLKTASAIGIDLPSTLLQKADVIFNDWPVDFDRM